MSTSFTLTILFIYIMLPITHKQSELHILVNNSSNDDINILFIFLLCPCLHTYIWFNYECYVRNHFLIFPFFCLRLFSIYRWWSDLYKYIYWKEANKPKKIECQCIIHTHIYGMIDITLKGILEENGNRRKKYISK